MNSADIFYYSSSFSVLIAVVVLVYLAFQITLSLKSLRRILDDVGDVTSDVTLLKSVIKRGFSNFGSFIGDVIEKGGVGYGKKEKRRK